MMNTRRGGKKNKENGSSAGSDLVAEEFGVNLEVCLGRIVFGMILDHRGVGGAKFRAGLIESGAGSEAAEEFRHAMDAPVLHGRGQMMGAVTMLAMISVSAGYGIEGSRTPTIVADLSPKLPRRTAFPMTEGSLLKVVDQNR